MVSINEQWLAEGTGFITYCPQEIIFEVQLHLWKCIPRSPSQPSLICMGNFCWWCLPESIRTLIKTQSFTGSCFHWHKSVTAQLNSSAELSPTRVSVWPVQINSYRQFPPHQSPTSQPVPHPPAEHLQGLFFHQYQSNPSQISDPWTCCIWSVGAWEPPCSCGEAPGKCLSSASYQWGPLPFPETNSPTIA